jgi:Uma2 family endonuclease
MESAESLLDPLIRSPKLPLYVRQLQKALAEEQRRRRQFYETVQEGDKVEFINGEVVFQSPVRLEHNDVSFTLAMLIRAFADTRALGMVGHEKLMISLDRNDYEPDVCFWGSEKAAAFQPRQLRFPAPDFVAEVLSTATEAVDRGIKFEDYAASGVPEYWLIDVADQVVEQYVLAGNEYRLAAKTTDGSLKSHAIPGFAIPVRALFDQDERQKALRALLA